MNAVFFVQTHMYTLYNIKMIYRPAVQLENMWLIL